MLCRRRTLPYSQQIVSLSCTQGVIATIRSIAKFARQRDIYFSLWTSYSKISQRFPNISLVDYVTAQPSYTSPKIVRDIELFIFLHLLPQRSKKNSPLAYINSKEESLGLVSWRLMGKWKNVLDRNSEKKKKKKNVSRFFHLICQLGTYRKRIMCWILGLDYNV